MSNGGSLDLFDVGIINCVGSGGVSNGSSGYLEMFNCFVYNDQGSGLVNYGYAWITSGTQITYCSATMSGGVINSSGATLVVDGESYIANNSATTSGGGIANLGTLTMSGGAMLWNNTAAERGGGLYVTQGGTASLTDTSLENNQVTDTSDGGGGGIYVNTNSSVTLVSGCYISENTCATAGGGNGIYASAGSTLNPNESANDIFDDIVNNS